MTDQTKKEPLIAIASGRHLFAGNNNSFSKIIETKSIICKIFASKGKLFCSDANGSLYRAGKTAPMLSLGKASPTAFDVRDGVLFYSPSLLKETEVFTPTSFGGKQSVVCEERPTREVLSLDLTKTDLKPKPMAECPVEVQDIFISENATLFAGSRRAGKFDDSAPYYSTRDPRKWKSSIIQYRDGRLFEVESFPGLITASTKSKDRFFIGTSAGAIYNGRAYKGSTRIHQIKPPSEMPADMFINNLALKGNTKLYCSVRGGPFIGEIDLGTNEIESYRLPTENVDSRGMKAYAMAIMPTDDSILVGMINDPHLFSVSYRSLRGGRCEKLDTLFSGPQPIRLVEKFVEF